MFAKRLSLLIIGIGLFCGIFSRADDKAPELTKAQAETIASSLDWQHGAITLKDGLATINLTDHFRFLDHKNAEKVLHDLWGNPPDATELGMIFPSDVGPLDKGSWGIVISYEEGGYVKDDDADKINYGDLLKQMKTDVHDANEERVKEGYDSMELIGWAAPPRYDKESHKLYWAKEFKVSDYSENTLNYNIRILGRRGVLVLNAISSMREFPAIDRQVPEVLAMVDFKPGNTYADFDPKIDKIAKYGLATLVAGGALGAAAKLGLLGLIWKYIIVVALAAKKLIIVVIVAVVSLFKKIAGMFSKKSSTPEHLLPPRNSSPPSRPMGAPDPHPPVPPPARPVEPPPNIPPGPLG